MTIIVNQHQEQNQPKEPKQELTLSKLVSNFPFKEIRPKQLEVLLWAKTYVLDSAFSRFIRENKLPVWFRECII